MNDDRKPLNKLPWLPLSLRKEFPSIAAVYFCVDDDDCVQYIGQTTNVRQRFAGHHRLIELNALDDVRIIFHFVPGAYSYEGCSPQLIDLERRYINELNPPLNGSPQPRRNRRRSRRM